MSLTVLKRTYRKACEVLYPNGVAFVHVPKCAGSSVSRAFRVRFLASQTKIEESGVYEAGGLLALALKDNAGLCGRELPLEATVHALKRAMFAYYLSENVKFVQGHVHFDRRTYETVERTHKFITLLRDPVERYLSQYYYDYGRPNKNHISDDLETFVDTPHGIDTGRVFLDYFGETHRSGHSESEYVERAKENLDLFAVVGFLDDLDAFRWMIADQLGINMRFGHVNKGSKQRSSLSGSLDEKIRHRCAVDIEIYEYAKSMQKALPRVC